MPTPWPLIAILAIALLLRGWLELYRAGLL
jgi:hypothetical protein